MPAGIQQRLQRELIEQHHHHRRQRLTRAGLGRRHRPLGAGPGGHDQLRGGRQGREHQREHQRRGGQIAQPQPDRRPAGIDPAGSQPHHQGGQDQPPAPQRGQLLGHLQRQQAEQAGHPHQMDQPPHPLAGDQPGQYLGGPQAGRRGEHDQGHQQQDLGPIAAVQQEKVGCLAGHIQQRLGHRQPGQGKQLQQPPPHPNRHPAAEDHQPTGTPGALGPGAPGGRLAGHALPTAVDPFTTPFRTRACTTYRRGQDPGTLPPPPGLGAEGRSRESRARPRGDSR